LTPQKSSVKIPRFFAELRTLETLKRYFRNDLMVASFMLYPQVRKVFEYLKKNDYLVSQTGSGPTLFVADKAPSRLRILARKVARLFNVKTKLTLSL
jgi:4-diphosphocytidyl-2C-methyl-D-erythritol kinase